MIKLLIKPICNNDLESSACGAKILEYIGNNSITSKNNAQRIRDAETLDLGLYLEILLNSAAITALLQGILSILPQYRNSSVKIEISENESITITSLSERKAADIAREILDKVSNSEQ